MNINIKRTISFLAVTFGFFMALLDTTIVNIALPHMTQYFNSNVEKITWVVNGYNIAFAVFIITASRIADQFGRKKLFLVGVFIFITTSFAAGHASSVELLIFYRVLQGLSAAIVVPITIPIVIELYPAEKHGSILGIWAAISGLAAASGPTLGGILTEKFNWQSVFYVNIPIGIIALILTAILINESYDSTASKRIDWLGMIFLSVSIFSLTFGMIEANNKGWTSTYILALLFVSIISMILFIFAEFKVKEPMLPMWLMKIWTFDAGTLTLLIVGIGSMSSTFMLSFFLTQVRGMSVLQAGLLISTMPLSSILSSAIGGPMSNKYGSRWFVVAGVALTALSVYLFSGLTATSSKIDIIWRLVITGIGLGFSVAPTMGAAVRNVPSEKVGIVSGVTNMARSLGTVIGVVILVSVLNSNLTSGLAPLKNKIAETVTSNQALDPKIKIALKEKIDTIKISNSNSNPDFSLENILKELNNYQIGVLSETPDEKKDIVKEYFKEQSKEISNMWAKIMNYYTDTVVNSFSKAFKFACIFLIVGIIFAYFCDKSKIKDGQDRVHITEI